MWKDAGKTLSINRHVKQKYDRADSWVSESILSHSINIYVDRHYGLI